MCAEHDCIANSNAAAGAWPHLFDPRFVGRDVPCDRQNGQRRQRDVRGCERWKRQVVDGVVNVNNVGKCSEAVDNALNKTDLLVTGFMVLIYV